MNCTTAPISPGALRALQCIHRSLQQNGFAPSLREICTAVGNNSTSHASWLVDSLQRDGLIERQYEKARAIRLTAYGQAVLAVNVLPQTENILPPVPELAYAAPTALLETRKRFGTVAKMIALLCEAHTLKNMTAADLQRIIHLAELAREEMRARGA